MNILQVIRILRCLHQPPTGSRRGRRSRRLCAAMKRIEACGVVIPRGITGRSLRNIPGRGPLSPHPHDHRQPRISNHFFYSRALKGAAGSRLRLRHRDNVRQVIRDGFPRERILRSTSTGRASTSGLTCTVTGIRLETSSSFQGRFRSGRWNSIWCIPPQFFTLLLMRGNSEIISRMRGPPSDPGGSSSVPRLGLWNGRSGLPVNGDRPGLCREELTDHLTGAGFISPESGPAVSRPALCR